MTQIVLTITILFGVYFFGYFVGRKQILDDCDLEAWEVLEKIKEVVKDGNDN